MRKLLYHESYLCFITTVTKNRRPVFVDSKLAERLGTMIHHGCHLKGFVLLTYAIMPDHFHLLVISKKFIERASQAGKILSIVEGGLSRPPDQQPPDSSLAALMQSIKGTFSRTLKPGSVWQRGNFTWFIDDASSACRVMDYITLNAWRAGLPRRFSKAPYVWVDEKQIGNLLR